MKQKLPKGVSKNRNGYMAQARHEGVRYYLGTFKTPEEAGNAYLEFRKWNPGRGPWKPPV